MLAAQEKQKLVSPAPAPEDLERRRTPTMPAGIEPTPEPNNMLAADQMNQPSPKISLNPPSAQVQSQAYAPPAQVVPVAQPAAPATTVITNPPLFQPIIISL